MVGARSRRRLLGGWRTQASPPLVAMEFVAVEKEGVRVFTFAPESGLPRAEEPDRVLPGVNTAGGAAWSADGTLLGLVSLATGGVSVYNAAGEYAQLCETEPLVGGPVRAFHFSPLGTFVVTWERPIPAGQPGSDSPNVGVFDAKTGELRWSFQLKKMTEMGWPALKWNALETRCCRMVSDGVVIMDGRLRREGEPAKLAVPGINAFEVSPGAGSGFIAVCTPERKGGPATCRIYSLESLETPTASKSFFKAENVSLLWNHTGSALLVLTSMDVDDTGQNYYGNTNLYFMRPDGQEDCIVASAADGPVHDVAWSPTQDEFLLLHGDLPCNMSLHDGRKAQKRMDFGKGRRNTVKWNQFGRFVLLGGFGNLRGDMDFWNKTGKALMASTQMECHVFGGWAPDGRHYLGATCHPRMRVDNCIVVFDYMGNQLGSLPFDELLNASWRPRPRGAFADRPPSPGRTAPKAMPAAAKAAEAKKKAYVPPGARGGPTAARPDSGGLAAMLRQELGSSATDQQATTAAKVVAEPGRGSVPGAAPDEGGANCNSRNARKKRAKEAAQEKEEAEKREKAAAALTPAKAAPAKAKSAPAPAKEPEAAAPARVPANDLEVSPEVEKRIRNLRKKLQQIEKLKEKSPGELDPLQREKIQTEGEILAELRELGDSA